eukprot:g1316.t1
MDAESLKTQWIEWVLVFLLSFEVLFREQEKLRQLLKTEDDFDWTLDSSVNENPLELIGGVDISFIEASNEAVACLVVLQFPNLNVVYEDYERVRLTVPYIAGFLAFREAEPFLKLVSRVQKTSFNPQVILVDGNGILHPRQFGSASHLGVISDYPTIGVAKSLYCIDGLDEHFIKQQIRNQQFTVNPQEPFLGKTMPLIGTKSEVLGVALYGHGHSRTRNPVYISIGHRVSLESSVELVKRCCLFRIPEPIRQADLKSRALIRL